ncbi:hypothetical protein [Cytophaga hutchinsonii]|uniref:TonB C-terminal domain-containing protein n=1 Tax=Cytophaga hutchinsonii (strain ATCC 33406 / DSM 1761 / CIP 103989 / NBRC 15051 / NCIMB 9469 / D465) TaxID=269798 RepID=A0A6N4SRL1_CYTH3|nr:hypothetical protein [Cytophaga hutchinsonii]ABG58978.1 hypothetical protein CHU_1711 [Cytophaga hutchinsonii ATCC 33406]SFX39620.1 hypothetical protein SAMN04487930_103330 [Cytophaga hutchinsonii ATCC 33406]
MKNITSLFISALLMITGAFAFNPTAKTVSKDKKTAVSQRINTLIGNPTHLLNGANQSVMISYDVDANNVMHIKDVSTSNAELKEYITKRLNGKKFKNVQLADMQGVVKVHFVTRKEQKLYLQY